MAMASLHAQPDGISHGKLLKSRNLKGVKPILKKLHVHSHSERNSLDLDRGWDEQPAAASPDLEFGSLDYGARDAEGFGFGSGSGSGSGTDRRHPLGYSYSVASTAASLAAAAAGKATKSARDVSFTLSSSEFGGSGALAATRSNSFQHARSTSGASVATSTSGGRNSSFVHPFQQTPRTSTPPLLSYANSIASLDAAYVSQQREHSTIEEGDADDDDESLDPSLDSSDPSAPATAAAATTTIITTAANTNTNTNTNTATATATTTQAVASASSNSANIRHRNASLQSSTSQSITSSSTTVKPRRPSLTSSHRTSSLPDANRSLRATTTRSNSGTPVLRPTPSIVNSRSDLQSSSVSSANDSLLSGTLPLSIPSFSAASPSLASSPISPFRTSLDMNNFRIRSRPEMDTATRQEHVREARRKFEAKEREKEEKYAREQIRKRERADTKEAQKLEKAHRKSSMGNASLVSPRNSSSREKSVFHNSSRPNTEPRPEDVEFTAPSRSKSAKRRTNSIWTAFILWLRTRLLKLGRR